MTSATLADKRLLSITFLLSIKTLQEMQAKGLINKSNRLISPKTPVSNPSPA